MGWWSKQKSLAGAFGELRADYDAAKSSRYVRSRTGVSASGSGADYHVRSDSDYLRIMELARDLDRNDGVIGQAVTRLVDNVVQDGFTLDVNTSDVGVNKELKARWKDWSEDPDQCSDTGESTFTDLEKLTLRHVIIDGDVVHLPLKSGALETIEGHRVRTPSRTKRNVVLGFLLDERRRRLQCWITKEDVDPWRSVTNVNEITPYEVRDRDGRRQVFQVYNPKRQSQTRGLTALAPVVNTAGMLDDIQFAQLVKQQISTCWTVLHERALGYDGLNGVGALGSVSTEPLADGTTRTLNGIAPGMEIFGNPGEKLTGYSPQVPNQEFFPHVTLILSILAVNLGMPVQMLLLDPTKTNFSGWRGAIDQARIGFSEMQRWERTRFHRPVYLWKARAWAFEDVALGRALEKDSRDYFSHEWHPPTWRYIEPLKDAEADALRLEKGLSSPRRIHAERGVDWDDLFVEMVDDRVNAIRYAREQAAIVNAGVEDGDERVSWRELLGMQKDGPAPKAAGAPARARGGDVDDVDEVDTVDDVDESTKGT